MRSSLIFACGTALALLWASPADARGFETTCETAKLRAASHYFQCLTHAYKKANAYGDEPSEHAIARCDERFDRAFERAEAHGACRTPGGSSTLREPLKSDLQTLVNNLRAETGCANVTLTTGDVATCTISKTTSAIDLASVAQTLSGFGVTDDTAFWIQAWGGNGSNGNVCCNYGGRGGQGGYAQTTTSLSALKSAYGTTELYYYLGLNGTFSADAGGDGGTATLVTVNDLSRSDVDLADTLLIAGGGGGGGAGRGKSNVCGGLHTVRGGPGGDGATVFPVSGLGSAVAAGQNGGPVQSIAGVVYHGGQGGQQT